VSPGRKMLQYYGNKGHDFFVHYTYQFIVQNHRTVLRCTAVGFLRLVTFDEFIHSFLSEQSEGYNVDLQFHGVLTKLQGKQVGRVGSSVSILILCRPIRTTFCIEWSSYLKYRNQHRNKYLAVYSRFFLQNGWCYVLDSSSSSSSSSSPSAFRD
jgi:hypothetical protein